MKFFCVLWIWISLSEVKTSPAYKDSTKEYVGENITITCSHSLASTNTKYFCRDPCKDKTNILVNSGHSHKERYTLKDIGNGIFTVTITDLQESDSGIYWCGVERFGLDTFNQVTLSVSKNERSNWLTTLQPLIHSHSATTESSLSSSSTPADFTSSTSAAGPLFSSRPALYEKTTQSGQLWFIVIISLTIIMTIVFGVVLCIFFIHKRKSLHSNVDAETQCTPCTTETAGDYEEITETQQQSGAHYIYSTVNKTPKANQIQDPPLYSSLCYQPKPSCTNQTPNEI